MFLVIDNYDSFTYNLVQYLGELGAEMEIHRNDAITIEEALSNSPEKIIISPGPGRPNDAGITEPLIKAAAEKKIPVLGVCLGHQAIGEVYGAKVTYAPEIMHGKISKIHHNSTSVFKGIDNPFEATRYHSLILEKATLPDCFEITAWTEDNIIMGIKHNNYPLHGIQFHPESILTKPGKALLKNFLEL